MIVLVSGWVNTHQLKVIDYLQEEVLAAMDFFNIEVLTFSGIVRYHAERNHQGLDSLIIHPEDHVGTTEGTIGTRSRLGGMLNYYHREAA